MEQPLINILIRTSHRPDLFKRAIRSVQTQTYRNVNVIIGCDTEESWDYTRGYIAYRMHRDLTANHYWNLYCNQLKSLVKEGWFFYLDDDDYLVNSNALTNIAEHLINPDEGVICQMLRNGKPKPRKELMEQKKIECGRIGAPCLFLHSSKKDIANWDGFKAGDYRWIKNVSLRLPMKFIQTVVVQTGNNGLHGK